MRSSRSKFNRANFCVPLNLFEFLLAHTFNSEKRSFCHNCFYNPIDSHSLILSRKALAFGFYGLNVLLWVIILYLVSK